MSEESLKVIFTLHEELHITELPLIKLNGEVACTHGVILLLVLVDHGVDQLASVRNSLRCHLERRGSHHS